MSYDVPALSDREIEREAALLLDEFERHRGAVSQPPVPIEELVELHLKLICVFMDIEKTLGFPDTHGAIWVHERRVAIDQQLDPSLYPSKRGRYHFTLAHEAAHWRLHRNYVLSQADAPAGASQVLLNVIGHRGEKNILEEQANRFASYLLMPRRLVDREWKAWHGTLDPIPLSGLTARRQELLQAERLRRGPGYPGHNNEDDMILEQLSVPLAERFLVSPRAMRILLEERGYLVRD